MYYAEIIKDLQAARYSQHAAAFLLTLLPNVENPCLPKRWKPNDATDKLIDAVVRKAKQSHLPFDEPSLARVSRFGFSVLLGPREYCELNWAGLFLSLPRIQSFRAPSCVAIDSGGRTSTEFKNPYSGYTTTLETVHFVSCCIDEVSIAKFLKHSPSLKTLRYSHSTKDIVGDQYWNICDFVTAIEREVGNHLEGLSVSIRAFHGQIVPGRVSLSGFRRLQKLELPLEIAIYTGDDMDNSELFIDDLISASVSQLSFISNGTDEHAKILDVMFRDFAVRKKQRKSIVPALERIVLTCPNDATDAYKGQCASLLAETEKAGISLDLRSFPSFTTLAWNGEE